MLLLWILRCCVGKCGRHDDCGIQFKGFTWKVPGQPCLFTCPYPNQTPFKLKHSLPESVSGTSWDMLASADSFIYQLIFLYTVSMGSYPLNQELAKYVNFCLYPAHMWSICICICLTHLSNISRPLMILSYIYHSKRVNKYQKRQQYLVSRHVSRI